MLIIQTSSDEEDSQVGLSPRKKKSSRFASHLSPSPVSQQSTLFLNKKMDDTKNESASGLEDSFKIPVFRKRNSKSMDLESSSSTSSEEESDSSCLFEKEEAIPQNISAYGSINEFQEEADCAILKIETTSVGKSSIKRSHSIPQHPSSSASISTRKWKKVGQSSSFPVFPHTSIPPANRMKRNTRFDYDIYEYVPSLKDIAIRNPLKESFANWYFQKEGCSLCILAGPPGCGKVRVVCFYHVEESCKEFLSRESYFYSFLG